MIGSKVNVKVDKRDVTGAQGVHGVAFEIGTGGGCRVVTQHGVICHTKGKKMFIPYNQYVVMNDDTPVHKDLEDLRSRVLDGKWKYTEETSGETLKSIHKRMYGVDAVVSCKCKIGDCNTRKCTNCVCLRDGRPCGEDCLCVGRCENRFNVFAV